MSELRGNPLSLVYLQDSVTAAKRAGKLSGIQYRNGEVKFTSVLNSLQALIAQQDRHVSTRGQVVLNYISLYKALGGGWELSRNSLPIKAETLKRMQQRTNWGEVLEKEPQSPMIDKISGVKK